MARITKKTTEEIAAWETSLATAIAPHLGAGWSAGHVPYRVPSLFGPDNLKITLTIKLVTSQGYRLGLSGDMTINNQFRIKPDHLSGEVTEITVSPEKSPEAIAKEIQKRLLPGYQKVVAAIREKIAKDEAADNARRNLREQIAAILDVKRVDKQGERFSAYGPQNRFGGPTFNYLQANTDSVSMELYSVPTDLALDICKRVADYWAGKGVCSVYAK